MSLSPYSPRSSVIDHLTTHLSTRRLVPRHPQQDAFLVLTPKSRERINNEVQGRICNHDRRSEESTRFPLLTLPKSPGQKASLVRRWCINDELLKSAERFNEPLTARKTHKKELKKLTRMPHGKLADGRSKIKTCSQTCQTEFPADTKKWSEAELWADGLGSHSVPVLPIIDQKSLSDQNAWASDDSQEAE